MRKILILLGSILMLSCSGEDESVALETVGKAFAEMPNHVSEEEAIHIACDKVGDGYATRAISGISVEYVLGDGNVQELQNSGISDTLAYIVNFPDNKGFAVVASDNRIDPILAFSDNGCFSIENEAAKESFIDNIEDYMLENCNGEPFDEVQTRAVMVDYTVTPKVKIAIKQTSPYNKYVNVEHPGCPAGCVAVATTEIMISTESSKKYHGVVYPFYAINKAIVASTGLTDTIRTRIVGGYETCKYTYEQALDTLAKIIYWAGKDVNTTYRQNASGAKSTDAYELLKKEGYSVQTDYLSYSYLDVMEYLIDDCVVYMRGRNTEKGTGHAWVADGCKYSENILGSPKARTRMYIHCCWGWGGYCDGYFYGNVFSPGSRSYKVENYFAVKSNL